MYQNKQRNKMKINSYQAGKGPANRFAISKINIRTKLLQMGCFKFNSSMNLKKVFRKYILHTVFLTHILCLMIIYLNKKSKDIFCVTV